jgi:ABC-2 type transport system permease protein
MRGRRYMPEPPKRRIPVGRAICADDGVLLANTPRGGGRVLTSMREVVAYRSLLRDLVARDLKVRYKRSALGIVWTMLNPLLTMIVFTIVFGHVLRVPIENFTIYFLSSFLLWNFVSQATSWSSACFLGYAPLIKKIYVPRAVFVLATVISGLVNLLLSLIPLAAIMIFMRHPFTPALAFLPVPILLATIFALGLSLILAPLCIMFNDMLQLYAVWLMAWMYLTPIVYPLSMVPERWRGVIALNPMTPLVSVFRDPIYSGVLPPASEVAAASVAAGVALVVGWIVFERYSDRVAYLV